MDNKTFYGSNTILGISPTDTTRTVYVGNVSNWIKDNLSSIKTRLNVDDSSLLYGGAFYLNDKLIYIKEVIYNNPAIIVFWNDGTKTVVKVDDEDEYSVNTGILVAVVKKIFGRDFPTKLLRDWGSPITVSRKTLSDVRREHREKK